MTEENQKGKLEEKLKMIVSHVDKQSDQIIKKALKRKRVISYEAADVENQRYIKGSISIDCPKYVLREFAGIESAKVSYDEKHVYEGTETNGSMDYLIHANLAAGAKEMMQKKPIRDYFDQLSQKLYSVIDSVDDIMPQAPVWSFVGENPKEKIFQAGDDKLSVIESDVADGIKAYNVELIVNSDVDPNFNAIQGPDYVHAAKIMLADVFITNVPEETKKKRPYQKYRQSNETPMRGDAVTRQEHMNTVNNMDLDSKEKAERFRDDPPLNMIID